jgi:hypothetical protein
VRTLDFTVELWGSGLDVNVPDTFVFDVPVELCLPLVATIRTDGVDAKRELIDDVVDEIDRALLIVSLIDLQSSDSRRIIDCSELVATDLPALARLESQKLDIYLDMVAWNPLGVATSMYDPAADLSRQGADPIPLKCAINARARGLEVVVALEIPGNPLWTEMILLRIPEGFAVGGFWRSASCEAALFFPRQTPFFSIGRMTISEYRNHGTLLRPFLLLLHIQES